MKQRRKEQTNPTNELTANKASFLPHIPLKVNISNEIIGGLTTFLLLSYFFIVSSKILIQALSLKPEVAVTIYSAMVIISALFTVFASIIRTQKVCSKNRSRLSLNYRLYMVLVLD